MTLLGDANPAGGVGILPLRVVAIRIAALLVQEADPMGHTSMRLRANTAALVRDHVQANLDQKISTASMANMVRLSRPHFCRAFKVTFGSTFRRYLQISRLNRACDLMCKTDLPLIDIAYECGMCDQAHFCNCFRERFGVSPGQWRREAIIAS